MSEVISISPEREPSSEELAQFSAVALMVARDRAKYGYDNPWDHMLWDYAGDLRTDSFPEKSWIYPGQDRIEYTRRVMPAGFTDEGIVVHIRTPGSMTAAALAIESAERGWWVGRRGFMVVMADLATGAPPEVQHVQKVLGHEEMSPADRFVTGVASGLVARELVLIETPAATDDLPPNPSVLEAAIYEKRRRVQKVTSVILGTQNIWFKGNNELHMLRPAQELHDELAEYYQRFGVTMTARIKTDHSAQAVVPTIRTEVPVIIRM